MADRALLIGINAYGQVPHLRGPLNDVAEMRDVLIGPLGFPESGIVVLAEDQAVKLNVRQELRRLVDGVTHRDRILVHFSGHGSYTADLDGDEPDGYDELFCLYDMEWGNPGSYILDDEIRVFIEKLPPVRDCVIVLDACHSGTGLRQIPRPGKGIHPVSINLKASLARAGSRPSISPEESQLHEVLNRFAVPPPEVEARAARMGQPKPKRRFKRPADKARVMLLAACKSDQTAADAYFPCEKKYFGAHTRALCSILRVTPKVTPKSLREQLADAMKKGHFDQEPQVEIA